MQDERRRPSPEDAADTGRFSSQEPPSGAVRRSRTQSDITSALDAPPLEDLTRPEVHLPVDVPPDDLTEMHSVYGGGDESSVSLPLEAPFGAHQAPEAEDLRIDAWTPARSSAPPPARTSTPSAPIASPRAGSVTRVRTRTIAVEEDPTSGWSMPEARAPTMPPPSVIVATASTPPSVMVSPSLAPPVASESWAPPQPVAWPAPAPPPPQGPRTMPPRPFGTVEMNLQVMQGVPTPVPFAPPVPPSVRPTAPPPAKGGVSAGVWVIIVVALLACGAMIAYGRLRG